jgi:lipid II:glycine glycyltransferase (peptidoglycan interpeptide bridge formation enzyme)
MDGIVTLAAYVDEAIAGMTIWFEHSGVAVSHLTAANSLGNANGANYALNGAMIEHFAGAETIDLGGGAGNVDDPSDGLFQFKRGFANAETVAFLCGAVLDQSRYLQLRGGKVTTFFPAYRG